MKKNKKNKKVKTLEQIRVALINAAGELESLMAEYENEADIPTDLFNAHQRVQACWIALSEIDTKREAA